MFAAPRRTARRRPAHREPPPTRPVERQALAELRAGEVDEAIDGSPNTAGSSRHPTDEHAFERMVADWHAATRGVRRDHARPPPRRRRSPSTGAPGSSSLPSGSSTTGRSSLDRPFAGGDRVVTLHNDHRHGLINGQRGTIITASPKASLSTFDGGPAPGRARPVLGSRTRRPRLRDDRPQSPRAHLRPRLRPRRRGPLRRSRLHRLSRGRHENRLYVTVSDETDGRPPRRPRRDGDPIDGIRAALYRSERQHLASRSTPRPSPLRVVLPRHSAERHPPREYGYTNRSLNTTTASTSAGEHRGNHATLVSSHRRISCRVAEAPRVSAPPIKQALRG